ncbi:MAG: hypothetical protein FWC50_06410, partial [Planctomycetaceae bacterium]|nr:hypothetical protein [Planctomycetaceae bacterium]
MPNNAQPASGDVLKKFHINGTSASVTDVNGEINITDADIAALVKAYPELTDINFVLCDKITGSGLKGATKLRRLLLQRCHNLTDDGLKPMKEMTQLEDVILTFCSGITDAGIENLKDLTKLKSLQLIRTSITDEGLKYFKNMKNLELLNLNECQNVTAKGIAELQKALPKCGIPHNVNIQPANRPNGSSSQKLSFFTDQQGDQHAVLKGKDVSVSDLIDLEKQYPLLKFVTLNNCDHFTDSDLEHLKSMTQIKGLAFIQCPNVNGTGLKYLEDMPQWEALLFAECDKINDASLENLKYLKQLRSLNVGHCPISDNGLERLKESAAKLKSLTLSGCPNITDEGLKHLAGLKELEKLYLYSLDKVTASGLENLKELPKLKTLSFYGCPNIIDAGLKHLAGLKNLESLDLTGCDKVTDKGIAELQKALPNCKISHGSNNQPPNQPNGNAPTKLSFRWDAQTGEQEAMLTGKDINANDLLDLVKNNPSLKAIQLGVCDHLTDADLECLKNLTQLKKISFNQCPAINGTCFKYFKDLPQLEILVLVGNVADADWGYLKDLKQLQSLHLMTTQISDSGLENLKGLTKLKTLWLNGNQNITDAGLKSLAGLKDLEGLDLTGCDKMTDKGVAELQKALPNCKISYGNNQQLNSNASTKLKFIRDGQTHELKAVLTGKDVTANDLLDLVKNNPSLKVIELNGCDHLTDSDLE